MAMHLGSLFHTQTLPKQAYKLTNWACLLLLCTIDFFPSSAPVPNRALEPTPHSRFPPSPPPKPVIGSTLLFARSPDQVIASPPRDASAQGRRRVSSACSVGTLAVFPPRLPQAAYVGGSGNSRRRSSPCSPTTLARGRSVSHAPFPRHGEPPGGGVTFASGADVTCKQENENHHTFLQIRRTWPTRRQWRRFAVITPSSFSLKPNTSQRGRMQRRRRKKKRLRQWWPRLSLPPVTSCRARPPS
jgi:hypothetical protein